MRAHVDPAVATTPQNSEDAAALLEMPRPQVLIDWS